MNDSTPSNDANANGIALLCGICLATGIALGGNGRDSDQALIVLQEQQSLSSAMAASRIPG